MAGRGQGGGAARRAEQSLSISIGALDTHGPFMQKCCDLLVRHTPRLNITMRSLHSDTMYEAVEKKRIDIGFSSIEAAYPSIRVEPCFSEPLVGVCRMDSPFTPGRTMDIADLDPQHEIFVPWTVGYRIWHDKHFDPRQSCRLTISYTSMLAGMLKYDCKWAIIPASYAKHCFDNEQFARFRISPAPPDRACFKLTRRNARPTVQCGVAIVESYLDPIILEVFGPNRDGRNLLV